MSQPCSTDAMGVSPHMGVEGKDGSLCHFLIFRPLRAVAHGHWTTKWRCGANFKSLKWGRAHIGLTDWARQRRSKLKNAWIKSVLMSSWWLPKLPNNAPPMRPPKPSCKVKKKMKIGSREDTRRT